MAHMKVKELVSAAYAAAADRPPAEAILLRALAARLDVTFVALTESIDRQMTLTAELESLRGASENG